MSTTHYSKSMASAPDATPEIIAWRIEFLEDLIKSKCEQKTHIVNLIEEYHAKIKRLHRDMREIHESEALCQEELKALKNV